MSNIKWELIFRDRGINKSLQGYLKRKWYSIMKNNNKVNTQWKDERSFIEWYLDEAKKGCHYCNIPQGEVKSVYGHLFKKGKGKRGRWLEVERTNSKNKSYDWINCVLACYPCNNAKSNVFTEAEFVEIGKAIKIEWIRKARAKGLWQKLV